MPFITTDHGVLVFDDPGFDRTLRVLFVSDLQPRRIDDGTSGSEVGEDLIAAEQIGEDLQVPASHVGLPGGFYLGSTTDIYKRFDLPVSARVPLTIDGADEAPILDVGLRATSARSFTGLGIRTQRAVERETNDVERMNAVVAGLTAELKDDVTLLAPLGAQTSQKQEVASFLRSVADTLEASADARLAPESGDAEQGDSE